MHAFIAIGVGLAMGLAALGVAIGQGLVGKGAMEGISRQPEMSNKLIAYMIVAMAVIGIAAVIGGAPNLNPSMIVNVFGASEYLSINRGSSSP